MLTGVLGNVLVLSPLMIAAQGRLTHRLLVALTDDIANSNKGFQVYYASLGEFEVASVHELLKGRTWATQGRRCVRDLRWLITGQTEPYVILFYRRHATVGYRSHHEEQELVSKLAQS